MVEPGLLSPHRASLAAPDPAATNMGEVRTRPYRLLSTITLFYITMQLVSDVTAGKIISLFGFTVSVTALYFPFTYIISDVLTEVYGYAQARRVLWQVLICSVIAGLLYQLVVVLPPAQGFDADPAYRRVFGQVPRVLLGGWIAVFAGDIVNNYILARLKVITKGRWLWTRTISSTIAGQFLNTALFYVIALSGVIPTPLLISAILSGWLLKTVVEVLMTPVTYWVVGTLKRVEQEDYFDTHTNFNPLKY
jgi:queuosine precursor transporter